MNTARHAIDDLLAELRHAGQHPPPALLASISALGAEAIPALIALVTDPAAYQMSEDEDDVSYWAPYPAVQILGELHPPEALEPLLLLITWDDYDYLAGIVPEALANFGRVALDPLSSILADQDQSVWTRGRVVSALGKMAGVYPELRDEIVTRLTAQLDTDEPDNEDLDTVRGFLVGELVELQAEESIRSIIRAFEETEIDPYLIAWSDVRDKLDIPSDIAPHLDEFSPQRGRLFGSLAWPPTPTPPGRPDAPSVQVPGREAPEPYRRQMPKVGRNDPCPCGSGKKYKKCHGR